MNRVVPPGHPVIKRLVDILGASAILLGAAPVMLLAMLGILVTMGRPVFFRHRRPGLDGRIFEVLKFRTMHENRALEGKWEFDEQRQTRIGRLLRSTSLDELPQLINVLRGEMSLVGPRPLMTEYLPYYTKRERLRHSVKPGITGWAQINGRNSLPWDQRLALDVWYVEHQWLGLDLRILGLTVLRVLQHRHIAPDPSTNPLNLDEERSRSAARPR